MAAFTRTFIGETTPVGAVAGDLWLKPSVGTLSVCLEDGAIPRYATIGGGTGGTVAVADSPAGGVGAAAGGYDTAGHRDSFIASFNALLATLRTKGIIS